MQINDTEIPHHPSQNGNHQKNLIGNALLARMWEEKGTLTHNWWGRKSGPATVEISMEVPQKTKTQTTLQFCYNTPEHVSEEMKVRM
jgi:hypothetical protein